ncbi:hypothetical protein HK405_012415, partial [Cladochytrium tenue]
MLSTFRFLPTKDHDAGSVAGCAVGADAAANSLCLVLPPPDTSNSGPAAAGHAACIDSLDSLTRRLTEAPSRLNDACDASPGGGGGPCHSLRLLAPPLSRRSDPNPAAFAFHRIADAFIRLLAASASCALPADATVSRLASIDWTADCCAGALPPTIAAAAAGFARRNQSLRSVGLSVAGLAAAMAVLDALGLPPSAATCSSPSLSVELRVIFVDCTAATQLRDPSRCPHTLVSTTAATADPSLHNPHPVFVDLVLPDADLSSPHAARAAAAVVAAAADTPGVILGSLTLSRACAPQKALSSILAALPRSAPCALSLALHAVSLSSTARHHTYAKAGAFTRGPAAPLASRLLASTLCSLDLRAVAGFADPDATALAAGLAAPSAPPRLRTLRVVATAISTHAVLQLLATAASGPATSSLRIIDLSEQHPKRTTPDSLAPCTDADALAIALATDMALHNALPALQSLDLSATGLSDTAAAALAGPTGLGAPTRGQPPTLLCLCLARNQLADGAAAAIAASLALATAVTASTADNCTSAAGL